MYSGRRAAALRTQKGVATPAGRENPPRPRGSTSHFSIGRTGGTVIVTIHGQIDAGDWAQVDAVLQDLIDAQGNLDVILDLGEVASLQRAAVPLIVSAAHQAHRHGGRLRLADRACHDLAQATAQSQV